MRRLADCSFCSGLVEENRIDYDYRRKGHFLVITNVPAGVCRQCGEKYFDPAVLKRMDKTYHDILDRQRRPDRLLEIPAVSF